MKKIILTVGCPASAKSTWAKNKVADSNGAYKRINRDDLRTMLDPDGKGGYIFSKSNEKFVTVAQDALILKALSDGKHVILDDTNFGTKVFDRVTNLVKGMNVKVEINDSFCDVPLEELIRRDNKRANGVGESVIRKFYNKHIYSPPVVPVIEYDESLQDCLICDLDGTTSLVTGRSPYDWKACINDKPNKPVIELIKTYHNKGVKIIFFSGRSDIAMEETLDWLDTHVGIDYEHLEMRKHVDQRKDTIVKKEFYDSIIKDKYNVLFCLDDRNCVVDMYRQLGLTVMAVAKGDF